MTSSSASPNDPVPSHEAAALRYTGRFAGGVILDIQRRLPFYAADFRQGLHPKVVAASLFLFFACFANAVAFGSLTGVATGGAIGTVEMLVATAIGGCVFALLGGQPLTLLGGTGPIVVFTGLLYGVCLAWDLPFLETYAWTGIWSGIFMVVLAVTDASALMRYFTRFTDEIFASLIAVIFIVEATAALLGPLSDGERPAAAMLTLILGIGTFALARGLRNFQRTRYLWRTLRTAVSDFGPALAIGLMRGFAVVQGDVAVETPAIPSEFSTTNGRSWFVNILKTPLWLIGATIVPALMATILLFLDQNITTRLVNSPGNRLRHGAGYHLDVLVVGLIILGLSFFALPWIVAATIHSLNHVKSLATIAVREVGGETKDVILHVRENRISGLVVHIGIGASILLLPLIQLVPMAVLYGLFLFMGFSTLVGNQFFERLTLWVTDPRLYPNTHYTRRVAHWRIHIFTAIQVAALGLLWVLKASAIGILFPVLIALLVPLRLILGRWFSGAELRALDAEEEDVVPEAHSVA